MKRIFIGATIAFFIFYAACELVFSLGEGEAFFFTNAISNNFTIGQIIIVSFMTYIVGMAFTVYHDAVFNRL